jgi:hypothetical protein
MKKLFLLISLLLGLLPAIKAQSIQGGLIAGFNMSQVDGDEVYGFHKYGLNVGAMAIVPIKKNFSFSLETLYNQKGSFEPRHSTDSINGSYKLILNYLEAPVMFNYTDKDIITAGVGFSWGRLVQFAEWEQGTKINWNTKFGPYIDSDIDALFDVRFRVAKGLKIDLRYSYSLASLRTRTYKTGVTRHQFNNFISLRLIYVFGEKDNKVRKDEKDNKNKKKK